MHWFQPQRHTFGAMTLQEKASLNLIEDLEKILQRKWPLNWCFKDEWKFGQVEHGARDPKDEEQCFWG